MMRKLVIAAAIAAATLLASAASAQRVGDRVLSRWRDSTQYFPGVIVARSGPVFTVRFDDREVENRRLSDMRPFNWRPGSRITCQYIDSNWYDATIETIGPDGLSLNIRYDDDGVRERTRTARCRTRG